MNKSRQQQQQQQQQQSGVNYRAATKVAAKKRKNIPNYNFKFIQTLVIV